MRHEGRSNALRRWVPGGVRLTTGARALGLLLTVILLALALPLAAAAEEPLSPEALEIANELNCPVCQGQSVRDSNSQLARQMRQVIQQKLDAGESPDAIKAYFVQRYGIEILREPPREGFIWALWWGPVIGLALGGGVLFAYLRRGASRQPPSEESDSEVLQRVEERLLSGAE